MSYISLYRKYRPKLFADVVGQKYIITTLKNAIKQNKLSHAYIFAGPRGIGKTTIAKVFAKALNCLQPIDGDACDVCIHCAAINQSQTTDVIELDAASNNGIEDVRNIVEGVKFLPTVLNKKVYIIDEAHMLTVPAWNAMLKTIEETPSHVIFIFATTEIYKIPATILSRCQYYQFGRLVDEQLNQMIFKIAKLENINIDKLAINKIVSLVDGSARDALSILEQLAMYSNNNITIATINEVFGLIDDQQKLALINDIITHNTQTIMQRLDTYALQGINFGQLANELILILIDKLVYLQTKDLTLLKKLTSTNVNDVNINQKQAIDLINVWQEAYMKIRSNTDMRFYFEAAVFSSFKASEQIVNDNNAVQSQPEIISTNNQAVEIKTDNVLPPLNQVFSFKEHNLSSTQNNTTKNSLSIEDIFTSIAYNHSTQHKQKSEAFINNIKEQLNPGILSFIIPATKVIVASQHGFVLVFDDQVDADLLNNKYDCYDFLNEVRKYCDKPMYIIGVSREQLLTLTNKFKNLISQGRSFLEPPINNLEEILKNSNSITQTAFEIFNN